MCWPEADEPYEKFIEAFEQFKKDVHQELVYSKGINEKYIKVYENETTTSLWIYYQRKTLNVLKIVVNADMGVEHYQKNAIQVFGEDDTIVQTLLALDSVSKMEHYMNEVREIVYQDQVIVKLKYGDLSGNDSSG